MKRCPYQLKNFFLDDCLKDYLVRFYPQPPAERSLRLHNNNRYDLRLLAARLTSAPSYLEFDVKASSLRYEGVIPCAVDHKTLQQLAPNFVVSPARNSTVTPSYYVVVCALVKGSQASWLQHRQRQAYHSAKLVMYREMLSFHLNEPVINIGYLEVDQQGVLQDVYVNDVEVQESIDSALQWLEFVEQCDGSTVLSMDTPPHVKMMPNLAVQDEYSEMRERLAWQWRDVGLLYWVGPATKADMHRKNIFTLNHPGINAYLQTQKMHAKQTVMLPRMFQPVELLQSVEWRDEGFDVYRRCIYLDIETTTEPNDASKVVCNVVGLLYAKDEGYEYRMFTSKDSSSIQNSTRWIQTNLPDRVMVHYTAADKPAVPEGMATLDLYDDIQRDYLKSESLQALNLNNFKLKTVYKRLCQRLGLPNLYGGCVVKNGLQAMYVLERFVDQAEASGVPNVIKYNRVDCLALALLHQYLQGRFDQGLRSFIVKCSEADKQEWSSQQDVEDTTTLVPPSHDMLHDAV